MQSLQMRLRYIFLMGFIFFLILPSQLIKTHTKNQQQKISLISDILVLILRKIL